MKAIQHLPGYSSCDKEVNHFLNLYQLLSIPFVEWYSDQSDFHRYSLSLDDTEILLMAETNGGEDWWVICNIEGSKEEIESLGLPIFEFE